MITMKSVSQVFTSAPHDVSSKACGVQRSVRRQVGIELLQGDGHRDPTVLMIIPTEETRSSTGPVAISKLGSDVKDLPAILILDLAFHIIELIGVSPSPR